MKASDVYREAARLCAENEVKDPGIGACSAIAEAKYPKKERFAAYEDAHGEDEMNHFCELFKPSCSAYAYWGYEWANTDSMRRNCRTIALCFMAAIAEDEERGERRRSS